MHILHPCLSSSIWFIFIRIIIHFGRVVALKPMLHFLGCNWTLSKSLYLRNDRSDCMGIEQIVFIHPSWEKYHLVLTMSYKVFLSLLTSPFTVKDKTYSWGN